MRKIVSIVLSLLMISALFCIGASATDAVAISSAADFAAMAPDGNYVLAADITIDATYEVTDGTAFTGTLDGAGHTVTTSVPMFALMNGTVKNLTVVGDIVSGDKYVGAVAMNTNAGNALFENITNKANVTSSRPSTEDACLGGILGKASNGSAAILRNCVNEGAITGPEATGGICGESQIYGTLFENCLNKGKVTSLDNASGAAAGGIIGYNGTDAVIVKNCTNNGEIVAGYRAGGIIGDARKSAEVYNSVNNGSVTAKHDALKGNIAGGIIGYACDGSTTTPLVIDGCINNGKIDSYIENSVTGDAAGIIGNAGSKGIAVNYTIKNCLNTGDVSGGYRVGGIAGYGYGTNDAYYVITNCVNIGKVSAGQFGSQFVAYTNSVGTTIKNCIGAGEMEALPVTDKFTRLAIFSCSNVAVEQCTVENVFIVDGGKTEWLSWASYADGEANAKNRIPLETVLGKDLDGSAYKFNTYTDDTYTTVATADNEMVFTNTAETPVNVKAITRADAVSQDLVDKANAAAGTTYVYLDGGKLTTIKPVVVDPTPVDPPITGDYALVAVAAVAVVAVLGIAYVSKKKAIAE